MLSVLRDSGVYLFARGLPALINFGAIVVYTRLLSTADYGRYALVITLVSVGNAVFFRWLNGGVKRFYARYGEVRRELLSSVLIGYLASSATAGLAALFYIFVAGDLGAQYVVGAVLLAVLWSAAELDLALTNAQLKPYAFGLLSVSKALLSVGLGSILALAGYGAAGVLAGMIGGYTLSLLLFSSPDWRLAGLRAASMPCLRVLLSYGIPLTATFALGVIIALSDRLVIWWLLDPSAVGRYAAGYDIASQLLLVLMMPVHLAGFPAAIKMLESDSVGAARDKLRQTFTLLLAIAAPACAGLAMLSNPFSEITVGPDFREAASSIIPVVSLATLLAGLKSYYFDLAFQLGERTWVQFVLLLPAALVNVLLNLLLIPSLGILGAAWATVAAYAVALALSALIGWRYFPLPVPVGPSAKIVVATLVMVLAVAAYSPSGGVLALSFAIAGGAIVYAVSLAALYPGRVVDAVRSRQNDVGRGADSG